MEDVQNNFLVNTILYGQNSVKRAYRKILELTRFLVHHLVIELAYDEIFKGKLWRRQRQRLL